MIKLCSDNAAGRYPFLQQDREKLVSLLFHGRTAREACRTLGWKDHIGHTHLKQIRDFLGFKNNFQLAAWLNEQGFEPIPLDDLAIREINEDPYIQRLRQFYPCNYRLKEFSPTRTEAMTLLARAGGNKFILSSRFHGTLAEFKKQGIVDQDGNLPPVLCDFWLKEKKLDPFTPCEYFHAMFDALTSNQLEYLRDGLGEYRNTYTVDALIRRGIIQKVDGRIHWVENAEEVFYGWKSIEVRESEQSEPVDPLARLICSEAYKSLTNLQKDVVYGEFVRSGGDLIEAEKRINQYLGRAAA